MNAAILTEATAQTGFGHVMRCLSIAQVLNRLDITPLFIVKGVEKDLRPILAQYPNQVFDWIAYPEELFPLIEDTDIVVIDSYLAEPYLYEQCATIAKRCIYLDDTLRLDYPKGIVVNPTVLSEQFSYPARSGTEYWLGSDYILLREPFWEQPDRQIPDQIEHILLTFGGSDIQNMTFKTLNWVRQIFQKAKITVIIGKGIKNVDQEIVSDTRVVCVADASAEIMYQEMTKADLAISACGQTLNELARCGVPTIGILVAQNQQHAAKAWAQVGFLCFAGAYNDPNLEENIVRACQTLTEVSERKKRQVIGQEWTKKGFHIKFKERVEQWKN